MDVVFPKKKKKETEAMPPKMFSVEGYKDDDNMWDYITQIGLIKVPMSSLYKSKNAKSKEEKQPDHINEPNITIEDIRTPPVNKDDEITIIE